MCINCISLLVGGVPEAKVKEKECHTEEAKKKVLIANFYRWNNKVKRIVVSN